MGKNTNMSKLTGKANRYGRTEETTLIIEKLCFKKIQNALVEIAPFNIYAKSSLLIWNYIFTGLRIGQKKA